MNRSAREGKKCTAFLSGPTDGILRYIKTYLFLPLDKKCDKSKIIS